MAEPQERREPQQRDPGRAREAQARDRQRDHAAIRLLADGLLPALMARLEASPLGELEVSEDGWRVRLRKPAEGDASGDGITGKPPAPAVSGERAVGSGTSPPRPAERPDRPRRVITSPAVGTFHPRAGTSLGRAVRAGDVVGHVEVLGVPQEVLAPFDGTLGRVLVEPGQVVEYGEQLIRIDGSGQASPEPAPHAAGSTSPQR